MKESIAREAACRELERQGDGENEGRRGEREGEEVRGEERPNLPPSPHSPPHSRPSPGLPQYSLSSQVSHSLPPQISPSPSHLPGSSPAELQHPAAGGRSSPHLLSPIPPRPPPPHCAHLLLVPFYHNCQLPRGFAKIELTVGHKHTGWPGTSQHNAREAHDPKKIDPLAGESYNLLRVFWTKRIVTRVS